VSFNLVPRHCWTIVWRMMFVSLIVRAQFVCLSARWSFTLYNCSAQRVDCVCVYTEVWCQHTLTCGHRAAWVRFIRQFCLSSQTASRPSPRIARSVAVESSDVWLSRSVESVDNFHGGINNKDYCKSMTTRLTNVRHNVDQTAGRLSLQHVTSD